MGLPSGSVNMKLAGPELVLVGSLRELDAAGREAPLMLAHIDERPDRLGRLVPAGIEGQDVTVEHALKQPDRDRAVAQDQPVLAALPPTTAKSSFS